MWDENDNLFILKSANIFSLLFSFIVHAYTIFKQTMHYYSHCLIDYIYGAKYPQDEFEII